MPQRILLPPTILRIRNPECAALATPVALGFGIRSYYVSENLSAQH
jgi:hypothetical protein